MTKSGLHFPPQWQFYYIHLCIKGKKHLYNVEKLSKSYGKALLLWYIISECRVSVLSAKATPLTPATHIHTQMHTYTSTDKYTNTLGEAAAAVAAKSLQSCPILRDPIDGSPPGSPVPGILQARTLEWVAISFSNA